MSPRKAHALLFIHDRIDRERSQHDLMIARAAAHAEAEAIKQLMRDLDR